MQRAAFLLFVGAGAAIHPPCPADKLLSCQLRQGWNLDPNLVEALEKELVALRALVDPDQGRRIRAAIRLDAMKVDLADHEKQMAPAFGLRIAWLRLMGRDVVAALKEFTLRYHYMGM